MLEKKGIQPDFLEVEALRIIWEALQSEEEKDIFWKASQSIMLNKGEFVYQEGDSTEYVYFLKSGQIRVSREGTNGRMHITRLIRPGQFFGLRSFLTNDCQRASIKAHSPVQIYRINSSAIAYIIAHNNAVCQYFLRTVVEEMNIAEERTIFLTQKYTRGRLAETLLLLIRYYGLKEDKMTIDIQLTRQELGELSNMTGSNAIRTLSDFAKEGVIELSGRTIKVLSLEGLEHISKLG